MDGLQQGRSGTEKIGFGDALEGLFRHVLRLLDHDGQGIRVFFLALPQKLMGVGGGVVSDDHIGGGGIALGVLDLEEAAFKIGAGLFKEDALGLSFFDPLLESVEREEDQGGLAEDIDLPAFDLREGKLLLVKIKIG